MQPDPLTTSLTPEQSLVSLAITAAFTLLGVVIGNARKNLAPWVVAGITVGSVAGGAYVFATMPKIPAAAPLPPRPAAFVQPPRAA